MSLISVLLTSGYWFGITTMTDVNQARIFCLIACFASPPCSASASASASAAASLFRRFLHISPLSQPPFIFFLARSMQGSAAGISISPLCASTIVNSRPRGENRGDWTRSKNHSSFDLFCWRLLVSSV